LGVTQTSGDSNSVDFGVLVAALVSLIKSLDAYHVSRTLLPFLVDDLEHSYEERGEDQSCEVRLTLCTRFSRAMIGP